MNPLFKTLLVLFVTVATVIGVVYSVSLASHGIPTVDDTYLRRDGSLDMQGELSLPNGTFLRGRNLANNAYIDMFQIDSNNRIGVGGDIDVEETNVLFFGNTTSISDDASDNLFLDPQVLGGGHRVQVGGDLRTEDELEFQGGTAFVITLGGAPTVNRVWTFQNSTDTVVGRATTDTLTNKTLTSPDINGGTWNGTIDAATSVTADITLNDNINATFGTGIDATIDWDTGSTQFIIDPDLTGGELHIAGPINVEAASGLNMGGNGPASGTSFIVFGDGTPLVPLGSNAGIYADDVAGTVHMFVVDETGSPTQISPHPRDFLDTLGLECPYPWAFNSSNPYLGVRVLVDWCSVIMTLEALTGEQFMFIEEFEATPWDQEEEPPKWLADRGVAR